MTQRPATTWDDVIDRSVAFRQALHRQPELAWSEVGTARRIRDRLTELGIEWRPCAETGTLAIIAPRANGRHIALRADIDGLPIRELTGLEWASEVEGRMHACGHDGHTATLFATAAWLKRQEQDLPGPVTLLFQPAEEGGHGAREMIADGALEGVEAVYGWHNWPAIPFGQAVCPDGAVMAGNGTFELEVRGQGGHSSQPEACRDPVLAGAAIVTALQQVVARRLTPQHATVLSVTSFDAKSGPTVIPDVAMLEGSFRLADPEDRQKIEQLIEEVATSTARAYGTTCEVTVRPRYDATINHAAEAERYRQALRDELGPEGLSHPTATPIMASEDFSYYLKEVPGAFALIGSDDSPEKENHHNVPCHNARYDFNDALIPRVARVYARLAGASLPT
ncbi:MAG: N(2)-acetyl-L-2,4-diaminobutanoate deacetylase DoeB2 [Pseudomonadales bacterium]|jgi:hippurate hydrolase